MKELSIIPILLLVTSCSLHIPDIIPSGLFEQAVSQPAISPVSPIQEKIIKLNITEIFKKFDPGQRGFDRLFKNSLPENAYRKYRKQLDVVIKKHEKNTSKLARPSLIYKERIAVRKRSAKKEWIWGNTEKSKISQYYDLFKHPYNIYEHKVSYQTTKTRNDGVMDESPQKVVPTANQFSAYYYRPDNSGDVYIIAPYIFIQSIL